ncbi:MAG: cytochrome P450 [Acidobacteria bacterium]|nr:cytochrome P450 [Acidobacteriota bacterium]MXZ36803.1 cytochrome P450 [Holophagales bacterium]MYF06015.1 cytochrome P450 [Holophagales bacterium]MYJ26466.1 cytochrome P450 [Holophagales bacterium]
MNREPKTPPGPQGRRLRNFRQRTTNHVDFVNQLRCEYGEIVSYRLPFMKCCVVFDAELIREVLVTQQPYFQPWFPGDLTDDWKYGSIALHQGEEQRRRSDLMTSAFAGDAEGAYADIVAEQATAMRGRLRSSKTVDLVEEFDRFVWDSVVEVILGRGVQIPRQLGEDTLNLAQLYLVLDLLPGARLLKSLPLPALRRGKKSRALVDEAIYGAIRRARDSGYSSGDIAAKYTRASDRKDRAPLLDCDEAIRDELIILLTGQIDGPTSALSLGIHYLSVNSGVRTKVEEEVDVVLNGGSIDGADYGRLRYVDAVFKEVLRVDPPTAVMLPKEATEDRVLGGYLIRKGTLVHVAMKALHHQPEYWDRPSEFRPERWLHSSQPTCPAHSYIPFGLGPHFCQGMEVARRIFVFGIASLAQKVRLEPRSADPPKRNDIAVGVVGPWTADVHERWETTSRHAREHS